MLERACLLGIDPIEFWKYTPCEFYLKVKGIHERRKDESNLAITQAYLIAYFQRVKKMPRLEEFLFKEPKKKMTDEEMFEEIKKINTQMGGMTY